MGKTTKRTRKKGPQLTDTYHHDGDSRRSLGASSKLTTRIRGRADNEASYGLKLRAWTVSHGESSLELYPGIPASSQGNKSLNILECSNHEYAGELILWA